MNPSIQKAFEKAASEGRTAFIPYISGGHPNLAAGAGIMEAVCSNGADILEVGIPFSDPVADGPVIQAAGIEALAAGATPAGILEMIEQVRPRIECPVVIMSYVNPILFMGYREFAAKAARAGVSGVIIPDITADEAEEWIDAATAHGLDTIFLAAPTTPADRLEIIVRASRGFVYYVSTTGVTGSQIEVGEELKQQIQRVREAASLPVAVGFGVATPEQARELGKVADGVIVGSALVKAIQGEKTDEARISRAAGFCREMAEALR